MTENENPEQTTHFKFELEETSAILSALELEIKILLHTGDYNRHERLKQLNDLRDKIFSKHWRLQQKLYPPEPCPF